MGKRMNKIFLSGVVIFLITAGIFAALPLSGSAANENTATIGAASPDQAQYNSKEQNKIDQIAHKQ